MVFSKKSLLYIIIFCVLGGVLPYAQAEGQGGTRSNTLVGSVSYVSNPLWMAYNSGNESRFYIPAPLATWGVDEIPLEAPRAPFVSLYSSEKHPDGATYQYAFFHILKATDTDEEQSVQVGPMVKLMNHSPSEPYVQLLGGVVGFGYAKAGETVGITLLGMHMPSVDVNADDKPRWQQVRADRRMR